MPNVTEIALHSLLVYLDLFCTNATWIFMKPKKIPDLNKFSQLMILISEHILKVKIKCDCVKTIFGCCFWHFVTSMTESVTSVTTQFVSLLRH